MDSNVFATRVAPLLRPKDLRALRLVSTSWLMVVNELAAVSAAFEDNACLNDAAALYRCAYWPVSHNTFSRAFAGGASAGVLAQIARGGRGAGAAADMFNAIAVSYGKSMSSDARARWVCVRRTATTGAYCSLTV
jgi:hypothetical protein